MARPRKTAEKGKWGEKPETQEELQRRKRSALIAEAGLSFRLKGFHNTSLDDVAKALNVTKPALYYYVKNKDEILFECIIKGLEIGDQVLAKARASHTSPLAVIEHFVRNYIVAMCREHGAISVVTNMSSLSPPRQEEVAVWRRKFDLELRELVRAAIALQELPEQDEKLAVFFFMGAVNSMTNWFQPEGRWSAEDVGDYYARTIIAGLTGPKP